MKKFVICGLLVFAGSSSAFSMPFETWYSFGVPFGNYFESGKGLGSTYTGSVGVDFDMYHFSGSRNVGLFIDLNFLASVVDNMENGRVLFQNGIILGPGFRYFINPDLTLHFGLGFNTGWHYAEKPGDTSGREFLDYRVGLGFGGNVGIKYDISDTMHVSIGTTLTYLFAGNRTLDSSDDDWNTTVRESSGWVPNYSMFGVSPYIGAGFTFHGQNTAKFGRPGR